MKRVFVSIIGASAVCALASGQDLLWDNGEFITGTGCNGDDASSIEDGRGTYGNSTLYGTYGQADDFTVPDGEEWTLDYLVWRNYQSSSPINEPIVEAYIEIYSGPPEDGNLVAGDMTTNRIISSEFSGVYRDNSDASCARAIKNVTVDMSWAPALGPGQYFIHYQSVGNPAWSGPWANHKVPAGPDNNPIGAEDNSRLYTVSAGTFTLNIEGTSGQPFDFPFLLYGSGGGGGGFELSLDLPQGCPGPVTASTTGGSAGTNTALIFARRTGRVRIPDGNPCAGTDLGLDSSAQLVTYRNDGDGNGSFSGNAPRVACGGFVQALDVATCTTSNVAQLN